MNDNSKSWASTWTPSSLSFSTSLLTRGAGSQRPLIRPRGPGGGPSWGRTGHSSGTRCAAGGVRGRPGSRRRRWGRQSSSTVPDATGYCCATSSASERPRFSPVKQTTIGFSLFWVFDVQVNQLRPSRIDVRIVLVIWSIIQVGPTLETQTCTILTAQGHERQIQYHCLTQS